MKRHGYVQTAALSIATAPVTGAYYFIDKNANQQVIVCQDVNCAHSVNGGVFSIIYSTATAGVSRWSFADYNGIVYAVDDKNDQPWSYDGTVFTIPFSTSVPLGSLIEQSKDRLIISGVTANPGGVYYSQSGIFTNFATGGNSADPWVDVIGTTGDKVTAIKYDSGNLYIFKRNSITLCILADQFSTVCSPIANTIGTSSPASITSAPDGIYFQAQTGSYWRIPAYGLYGLELISKKIGNFVRSQPSQFGATGNNFQGSVNDWNAGTQTPLSSFDTTSVPSSIRDNTAIFSDSTTVSFSSGTVFTSIDTATIANTIQLTSTTFADNWANSTVAGNLNWNATSGTWGVFPLPPNYLSAAGTTNIINTSSITLTAGYWNFQYWFTATSNGTCNNRAAGTECFEWQFLQKDANNYYSLGVDNITVGSLHFQLNIKRNLAGTLSVLTSTPIALGSGSGSIPTLGVVRQPAGDMYLFLNGVQVATATADTTITSSAGMVLNVTGNSSNAQRFGAFNFVDYNTPGTFISREFDTTFSTPTYGPFSSTFTVQQNIEGQLAFYTHVSTSPNNDVYDSYIASSDTVRFTGAAKRYIQYKAIFTTFVSTKTPTISNVTLQAATTGQFVTQCIQPGPNITSWGTFVCDNSNNIGAGSEVFYATSAATCAALPTGPPLNSAGAVQNSWVLQTNKSTLSISTNAAIYISWVDLLGASTDQAQINSCQTNWANGIVPQPVWGVYDPIKNAIYWSTNVGNTASNNRILKYDLNVAGMSRYIQSPNSVSPWFPWSINATALRMVNNLLYFGSSTAGTWNQYGASGSNADNGAAINGYWTSKDFSCGSPFVDSKWDRIYTVARNKQGGTITETMTNSQGTVDNYTISIATSAAQNYVRSTHSTQNFSPAAFVNVQYANNAANNPFEINGFSIDCDKGQPMDVNP